jgi:hypothetical protein
MTAIKKTNTKSSKSPAPATAKTATAKPAIKKKAPVAAPAVAFSASSSKVAPVATARVVTKITAQIDVGFGNALYVRGEGPGLSWDRGVLMTCVGDDAWAITLGESSRPYTLKFLINDITWSVGPDFNVASGSTVTFSPGF